MAVTRRSRTQLQTTLTRSRLKTTQAERERRSQNALYECFGWMQKRAIISKDKNSPRRQTTGTVQSSSPLSFCLSVSRRGLITLDTFAFGAT